MCVRAFVCVHVCVLCVYVCLVVDSSSMGKNRRKQSQIMIIKVTRCFLFTHSTKPGQMSRMTGLSKFPQMYKILGTHTVDNVGDVSDQMRKLLSK